MKVFVMMGIPGSGKSTWACDQIAERIEVDCIRLALCGDESDQSRNTEVFEIAHARLEWLLLEDSEKIVVWDATNLTAESRSKILSICEKYNATTKLVVMLTPYDVCCKRNAARERVVPDHAMKRMDKQFQTAVLDRDLADGQWGRIEYIV